MIVFTLLKYKNFLSTGNQITEIQLNKHKNTLVIGPNGAGKSTLLDALTFSLFGKPFRKVNKGNVVNSINCKNCMVEINFSIGKKKYIVKRGVKPVVFEIYCDGKLVNQDSSVKDYQEFLEKNILRMNYRSFTQIVILGSASFTPFMNLNPNDRRQIVESLLDIQVFSTMSTIIKTRLQTNKEELEKNRILLTSKQDNKSYLEKTLISLKINVEKRMADLSDKMKSMTDEKKILEEKIQKAGSDIDHLLDKVTSRPTLKSKHTKLVSLQSKMESNRKRLKEEYTFFENNDVCPTCQQDIGLELKNSKIQNNQGKVNEIEDGLAKISENIDSCINEIMKIESILAEINNIKIEVSKDEVSINNVEKSIANIKRESETLSHKDILTKENEDQLQTINGEISELQKNKETILNNRQLIELGVTLLKDGGIKTKIVKQYLPIINKNINKYLAKMGFFVDFNINESFEETIKSRYRDEFSYNNFSEGEKLRIDLAVLLTWRHIAKLKNQVNVNLLIFDEILDRAMDSDGIDAFMKLMWDLGNDTNVFVISHKDTMIDKFEKIIKFEKVKGFSVLRKDE